MRGNIKSFEKPFTHAEVVALADRTLKRFGGDRSKAGRYARSMENRYESSKWAQVVEVLATSRQHATKKSPSPSVAKKTAAQLQREIDAALARKAASPSNRSTAVRGHSKKTARLSLHHSTKQSSPRQEEILMVANDAALEGLEGGVKRALKVLSQGEQRKITTTFNRTTPESASEGGFSKTGWIDEKGDPIKVDKDDIQEAIDDDDEQPVTEAIVRAAVKWLRDNYASEYSSDRHFHPGGWYSTTWETLDYSTGEEEERNFHLENFTEAEERLIHKYLF